MKKWRNKKLDNKIYYVSQYDNNIHNINDVEHKIINEDLAYVEKDCGDDYFRVDEEVSLWTLKEIVRFYDLKEDK